MKTVKVEMVLPVLPEGYEYTGEYRRANAGEHFYNTEKVVFEEYGTLAEYPIVRECKPQKGSKSEIEDAIDNLIDAIGIYGKRMDEPVSLIFGGDGIVLTQSQKGGGTKTYIRGSSGVINYIYENQGK